MNGAIIPAKIAHHGVALTSDPNNKKHHKIPIVRWCMGRTQELSDALCVIRSNLDSMVPFLGLMLLR